MGKNMLSIIILVGLTFAILGLLLGFAASYDVPTVSTEQERHSKLLLPTNISERDPVAQQKLFDKCIEDARFDRELTEDEYFSCAYSIYD